MTQITVLDSTGATVSVAKVVDTGQTTMAASLPVALASDQSALPVSAAALTNGTQVALMAGSTLGATAGIFAAVDPLGQQNVNPPYGVIFTDPFDGGVVDTTNRWTVTTGGTGTVTQTGGKFSVNSGTTALGFASAVSKPTFAPKNVSLDALGFTATLESPLLANLTRFWGKGVIPATPSTAIPITDGFGFLLTSTTFQLVVYAGSVQTAAVTLPLPTDTSQHIYVVLFRGDTIIAIGDNTSIPLGFTQVQPGLQTLPIVMVAIAGASGPAAGQALAFNLVALGDSGHNANQLADGTLPWITGTIKAGSTAPLATDTALVVVESPNSSTFADSVISGQGTQTASGNNILLATAGTGPIDTNGYRSISIEVVPTGTVSSGVVTFEASNDQVTYVPLPMIDAAAPTTTPVTTISPATGVIRYMVGNTLFRYVRARISTVIGGGGSLQAFSRLTQTSFAGPVSGTVLIGSGTVTTVSTVTAVTTVSTVTAVTTVGTVTTLANGQTAHSAASTGSPVRVGGRVNTAVDTTLVAGDASDLFMTTSGAAVNKPYAAPELDWNYIAQPSGIVNSATPVTIKAAGAAGVRNYITAVTVSNDTLGAATELAIRDVAVSATSQTIASNILTTSTNHGWSIGDTVIPSASTVTGLTAGTPVYVLTVPSAVTATFSATPGGSTLAISGAGVTSTLNHYLFRLKAQTTAALSTFIDFPTPLRGGTALATEIVTLTATVTGGVYFNAQGYQAP